MMTKSDIVLGLVTWAVVSCGVSLLVGRRLRQAPPSYRELPYWTEHNVVVPSPTGPTVLVYVPGQNDPWRVRSIFGNEHTAQLEAILTTIFLDPTRVNSEVFEARASAAAELLRLWDGNDRNQRVIVRVRSDMMFWLRDNEPNTEDRLDNIYNVGLEVFLREHDAPDNERLPAPREQMLVGYSTEDIDYLLATDKNAADGNFIAGWAGHGCDEQIYLVGLENYGA